MNSRGSDHGQVAGSCERGNEPFGSLKGGEFLLLPPQEDICSMQLVILKDSISQSSGLKFILICSQQPYFPNYFLLHEPSSGQLKESKNVLNAYFQISDITAIVKRPTLFKFCHCTAADY